MTETAILGVGLAVLTACSLWGLLCLKQEFGCERSRLAATRVWVIYLLHLALTVAAACWNFWPLPITVPVALAVGLPLFILGVALSAAGMFNFGSFKKVSGLETQRLVTDGIYAWTRNPQNVGWAIGLFGIALMGRSGMALALAAAFTVVFLIYVRFEERHLLSLFGEEYAEFLRNSPRILGIPRRRQPDPAVTDSPGVRDRQVAERV